MSPHPSVPAFRPALPVARPRRLALCVRPFLPLAAMATLALASSLGQAHDWTSPPARPTPAADPQPSVRPGWDGLLWAGPASGPPAAPSAGDCQRLPQRIDLHGPVPARAAWLAEPRDRRDRAGMPPPPAAPAPALATAPAPSSTTAAGPAAAARDAAKLAEAPAAAVERAARPAAPEHYSARQRPAQEPVTAGVVDDNADFGEYQAFRRRHAQLAVRQRDSSERYRLTVHDAAGRPVPDAQVTLHAGGHTLPLWARTDAGGQVWLHPRVAGLTEPLLEVQVRKPGVDGELRGSALLRRGQRDALQVRLDGRAAHEPTRLDLVFLVDATGSMADEIDKLRSSMQAMADQIARLPSRPQTCFALVAYRDRGDEFFVRAFDFSDRLDAFQQVLGGLQAGGGGDYPEAFNEALHTAVHRLSWRGDGATRMVVTVADAPPHLDYGAPWYDDDMQGALARGIKLSAVGASGLDRRGELVFRQMAQHTGGRFVFLTYADARRPDSGPGRETSHDVGNYSVETLDKLIVRLVAEELARRPGAG